MTQDEIIEMTRQAANAILGYTAKVEDPSGAVLEFYNRFAKLVAQHERQACEALCTWRTGVQQVDAAIDTCAAAIRARGQA